MGFRHLQQQAIVLLSMESLPALCPRFPIGRGSLRGLHDHLGQTCNEFHSMFLEYTQSSGIAKVPSGICVKPCNEELENLLGQGRFLDVPPEDPL